MQGITIREILKTTDGRLMTEPDLSVLDLAPRDVSIDSRTIREGEIFFAIKGAKFDGHRFVGEAFRQGACAAVVRYTYNYKDSQKDRVIVGVEDTLVALQKLAGFYRRMFPMPLVAITGSNGKTTTKDMTSRILGMRFRVMSTRGNFNNLIGLPLTLLRLVPEDEVAVVELGSSARGEIDQLCQLADPSVGLITNIGPAHLEFFGSIGKVAEAKGELLDYLDNSSTVILNRDDPLLRKMARKAKGRLLWFGIREEADIRTTAIEFDADGCATIRVDEVDIHLKVPGWHNVYNALGAIAVGRVFGISVEQSKGVLEEFLSAPLRCEVVRTKGLCLINDTYNANPASTKAALDLLRSLKPRGDGRRIAVLGEMLELGEYGPEAHEEIGRYAAQLGIDCIFGVGNLTKKVLDAAVSKGMGVKVGYLRDNIHAKKRLRGFIREGDVILIKGSRALGMEEIVKEIR